MADLAKIVEELSALTVLEAAELSKLLEEKWGVSAAAPVAVAAVAGGAAPAEAAVEQPQSLTLTPGATVKSADGSELGKLVGAQNGANGQELTVRGADGTVRAVARNGIRQEGSDIVVDATLSDFNAAAPIAGEEPATDAADTMAPTEPGTDAAGEPPVDEPRA